MPLLFTVAILAATLVTAVISGVFGMAGGLLMMGVLLAITPVATAMVLHGFIQIVANFSRALLLRSHICWALVGRYSLGVGAGFALILVLAWRPAEATIFVILGLTGFLVWIPKRWIDIDITRPLQAEICGFLVQLLNTLGGVAGPLLDLFFVKTDLSRQAVVATKATTQVLAHAIKIIFWGFPLAALIAAQAPEAVLPPVWALALIVPLSLAGTWAGGRVLKRMTDASFREWTKWIVTFTGAVYLARGLYGWFG